MLAKLTSRKFWTAVTGIVTSLILIFNSDENLIKLVTGSIMMIADTVIYIYSESIVDKETKEKNDDNL